MKPSLSTKKLILLAALSTGMCLTTGTIIKRNLGRPRRITQIAILTSSGVRLSSIFEGLSTDPRYDLKNIPTSTPTMVACPSPANLTLLDRIKNWFQPSAYASANCPTTACVGKQAINQLIDCSRYTNCSGQFHYAHWDPNGRSGLGTLGGWHVRMHRRGLLREFLQYL